MLNSLDQEVELLNRSRGKISEANAQVTAGWAGDAARQFTSGQNDVSLNLDRLITALRNMRELVQLSRDDFTNEEQEQIAEMQRAHSGLANMSSRGFEHLA
ncbi:hypothetical protein [Streptomyces marincola]|uniref:WXG100 family type VII secretion target n=1 Tax=Streptomyces marincola TaxID=2878388 RepID=A0A1W7CTV8_9ACTN|nr:hypothetical protein [Streptomyces marincola]ARQ68175.1 hypothetical protein CAG99_04365 [Streptomyces marincola]